MEEKEVKMTETDAAIAAGSAIAGAERVGAGVPYVVVPNGYDVHSLEEYLQRPVRKKGEIRMHDVDSFFFYIREFGGDGETFVFADILNKSFTGVMNHHHSSGEAGFCDHIAKFSMEETGEWRRWNENDGVMMLPLEFSDFVEANIADIADPPGADIMEMVSALRVKKKAEFNTVVDSATGDKTVSFTEETRGESVHGNIDVFGKFTLAVSPFIGCDKYAIQCRIRMDVRDGGLRICYQIINSNAIEEDAFRVQRDKLEKHCEAEGIMVVNGSLS